MHANQANSSTCRPRILIAGLRGSGGKTLVSTGLVFALKKRGLRVFPFKKGPDYIDAAWLGAAAGQPCRNLDLFMMKSEVIIGAFLEASSGCDVAIIEGNRGIFDGMDADGTFSTAELAKLLGAPVVIVADCSKTTRTMAAMIRGCREFDPAVDIKGIILNRVAGDRHENVLREAIEKYTGVPVLGAIPGLKEVRFPERHLGLVPPQEREDVPDAIEISGEVAEKYLDIDAIFRIASDAPSIKSIHAAGLKESPGGAPPSGTRARTRWRRRASGGDGSGLKKESAGRAKKLLRIGIFRDEAFQFYYPENLETLEKEGANLVFSSPLRDEKLPQVDAVYIGGGFPESFAFKLAENVSFRRQVEAAAEEGLPIYAECAGAVYLGRSLVIGDTTYPMARVLPIVFGFRKKPQGHGYMMVEVKRENPFYAEGRILRGHEFHYTHVLEMDEKEMSFAFHVRRGYGMDGRRDGACRKNVLATYCHVHALGEENWARSLVDAASAWKGRSSAS